MQLIEIQHRLALIQVKCREKKTRGAQQNALVHVHYDHHDPKCVFHCGVPLLAQYKVRERQEGQQHFLAYRTHETFLAVGIEKLWKGWEGF